MDYYTARIKIWYLTRRAYGHWRHIFGRGLGVAGFLLLTAFVIVMKYLE